MNRPSGAVAALARQTVRSVSSLWRPGNVAMFHGGRSGSTVLGLMLQETHRVLWAGELYETPVADQTLTAASGHDAPVRYLRRHMIHAGSRYYGFEVKLQHLRMLHLEPPEYVESLSGLGFDHFILLRRRNTLRALVSIAIAAEDGRYHQAADAPPVLRRVVIPVEVVSPLGVKRSLIARLEHREARFSVLEHALRGRNVLHLTYEEDVNPDPLVGYRRICSFLGMEADDVTVRLGRTNPFPLRRIIVNLDEVQEALSGSPYEWMLDD